MRGKQGNERLNKQLNESKRLVNTLPQLANHDATVVQPYVTECRCGCCHRLTMLSDTGGGRADSVHLKELQETLTENKHGSAEGQSVKKTVHCYCT